MSRKKRRFEQLAAAAEANKDKPIYTNPLQQKVGEKLEDVERQLVVAVCGWSSRHTRDPVRATGTRFSAYPVRPLWRLRRLQARANNQILAYHT